VAFLIVLSLVYDDVIALFIALLPHVGPGAVSKWVRACLPPHNLP